MLAETSRIIAFPCTVQMQFALMYELVPGRLSIEFDYRKGMTSRVTPRLDMLPDAISCAECIINCMA